MSSENLALNTKLQNSFYAAVKNIKKNLKGGDGKEKKFIRGETGVVKLSGVPHGFFETEIRKYFSQFGRVTRVRLARSRKTGNSKGFGFVEFKIPEVAKLVAETMNNYLMFDKILKAKFIPPEEQKFNYFLGVEKGKVPLEKSRKAYILKHNRLLTAKERKVYSTKISRVLSRKLEKLKKLGIDYNIEPVHQFDDKEKAVLTIDESDDEIAFKIPPNVKVVRKKSTSKKNEEKSSKQKKTKVDEEVKQKDSSDHVAENSASKADIDIQEEVIQKPQIKRRMSNQTIDDDNGGKSVLKKVTKSKGISKNKQRNTLNTIKNKDNSCESLALNSMKSPNKISETSILKAKPRKSFSSMWKIKECS